MTDERPLNSPHTSRRLHPWSGLGTMCALLCAVGCTNSDLYGVDITKSVPNKITLSGKVCTDSPLQRDLPVKVVLVMDGTPHRLEDGTVVDDIYQARARAVQNAIDRYPISRNYSFAMVHFAGSTVSYTNDRFSTDPTELYVGASKYQTICNGIDFDCVGRNYKLAMSRAASIITGDLSRATPGERARTTYAVIFYADGPHLEPSCVHDSDFNCGVPGAEACVDRVGEGYECNPRSGECCTTGGMLACPDVCMSDDTTCSPTGCDAGCALQQTIRELRDYVLSHGAAGLVVHTAHYMNPSVYLDIDNDQKKEIVCPYLDTAPVAAGLVKHDYDQQCCAFFALERMAAAGTGAYTFSEAAGSLNITTFDLRRSDNVFIKRSLMATNLNALPRANELLVDSDVDGLSDDEELASDSCLDPNNRDSDGDGLGDGLEQQLSSQDLDPCSPTAPVICQDVAMNADSDRDGLGDCEELLLALEPTLFDSDADGFPDLVEFLNGTNYLENDVDRDDDYDGVPNGIELATHTDPRANDSKVRSENSYLTRETNLGVQPVLIVQPPRLLTGVTVGDVSVRVLPGASEIRFTPGNPAQLAWHDSLDVGNFGPAVDIPRDGEYVLQSGTSEPGDRDLERSLTVVVLHGLLPPQAITETLQIRQSEHECTDFRIRNITLVYPRPGRPGEGQNQLLLYFSEVPKLAPQSPGIFRAAQTIVTYVPPDYKDPDVPELQIKDYQFVMFE